MFYYGKFQTNKRRDNSVMNYPVPLPTFNSDHYIFSPHFLGVYLKVHLRHHILFVNINAYSCLTDMEIKEKNTPTMQIMEIKK